ncbi:hypothetical protein K458DRAFT_250755, partial [Lentithecium fluviatile CBS 122367]
IDSICTNQSCINERNHQIGLMDLIYSRATGVLVSIHDPGESYSELLHWLRIGFLNHTITLVEPYVRQLTTLLSTRYFRRVWVIQEVALA